MFRRCKKGKSKYDKPIDCKYMDAYNEVNILNDKLERDNKQLKTLLIASKKYETQTEHDKCWSGLFVTDYIIYFEVLDLEIVKKRDQFDYFYDFKLDKHFKTVFPSEKEAKEELKSRLENILKEGD